MLNLPEILKIFRKGYKPKEEEFSQTWMSFWHKSERLPLTQILGLNDVLDKKVNSSDLGNISLGIKRYKADVLTQSDLPTIGNQEGDGRKVLDDLNESGLPYIWLWDGSSWSRTIFTSFPNNVATRDELPFLEGYATGVQSFIVNAKFELTLPKGLDIYGSNGKFVKRLIEDITFELHEGTGRIQYNEYTDVFSSTGKKGLDKDAYIIGLYYGQDVQLYASSGNVTQLDVNGNITDILYNGVKDSIFLKNSVVKLSCRCSISYSNNIFNIGIGYIYMRFGNGREKVINITQPLSFEFLESSELVIDSYTDELVLKSTIDTSNNKPKYRDVVLVVYDTISKFCGGLLYDYYTSRIVNNTPLQQVVGTIPRAKILITSNIVSIGLGYLYFKTTTGGTITYYNTEIIEHEFTTNSYMTYNSTTKAISVKTAALLNKDDIILFAYDNDAGICYGELLDYYTNQKVINGDITGIPLFVINEAEKTKSRLIEWIGNDDVVLFPILTDLHSAGGEKYKHIGYLSELNKYFNFDFVANLGDIGLDAPATNTLSSANDLLLKVSGQQALFNCLLLFCRGNHDRNAGIGQNTLSKSRLSNILQRPSQNKYPIIDIVDNQCYGCLDLPHKNTRIIFTDSSEIGSDYGWSQNQLQYIINKLNTANDMDVVILSHFCPDQMGNWVYDGVASGTKGTNQTTYRKILEDFVARQAGMSDSEDTTIAMTWDFSTASGRLVGVICGDAHFDAQMKANGVNLIITQGYGGIPTANLPNHGTVTSFSHSSQVLYDLVAIKRSTGQMKYFRIGAGGEQRDRDFSF